MAFVDQETGRLHLHIVYDGAPRSGKTTSVRALARRLGRQVETPEERQGRTIYFDWLDVVGGLYRDEPIQCRVIAVPGQEALRKRRAKVLAAADVVVFVADPTESGLEASERHFSDLRATLEARDRPIPIVVQLNKRDITHVDDWTRLQARLDATAVHSSTSVATEGDGVHEAFVVAVGEAIRALRRAQPGASGQPIPNPGDLEIPDPATLFDRMTRLERVLRARRQDKT